MLNPFDCQRCEEGLLTFINVRNCIKFYEVAEKISANTLKSHCNELISNHWEDFTSDDFAHMPAALLYQMFKSKTSYPLHAAIKAKREDVVFLYFIENDAIVSTNQMYSNQLSHYKRFFFVVLSFIKN